MATVENLIDVTVPAAEPRAPNVSLAPELEPIEQRLKAELAKDLLRFSTAGSVDDGKSTLIGRLLYD